MEFMKEKKPCMDGIPLSYVCHPPDIEVARLGYPAHSHD